MADNYKDILSDLKQKKYAPIYLLQGEEAYFIDEIEHYISSHVLTEEEQDFNQHIFYGEDVDDANKVIGAARRYPAGAARQVVVVREAQAMDKRELEKLLPYVKQPMSSTILVLCYKYGKINGTTSLAKQLKKAGVVFESQAVRDYQIANWIASYIGEEGYKIDAQTAALLGEYLGTNLGKIVKEVEKLTIELPKGGQITPKLIEKNIGISKDYNIFELQNAIGKRDILRCNKIINYFASNPKEHPIQMTIPFLFSYFSKLLRIHLERADAATLRINPFIFSKEYLPAAQIYNPAKLVANIAILREFDLKSKGVGATGNIDPADLQKEMIYKLTH
ncbi:MAG: DNA polymerase III subunit delta [Mangrovibacterium sp.]